MLFPIPGLPFFKEPIEFTGFEDAAALATALKNGSNYLDVLKAALWIAAQRAALSGADADALLIYSALHNPALQFLHASLKAAQTPGVALPENATFHEPVYRFADSLDAQLQYAVENWTFIAPELKTKIRAVLQYAISVRSAPAATGGGFAGEPPPAMPFLSPHYSHDAAWMQNLVIVAKNVPLWLAQLSTEYGHAIRRLDEIPDAELEFLHGCGVSGLWLVGLWQRSKASAIIKKKSGNEQAESSAYSVFAYEVDELYGGEAALEIFRDKARRAGIRLGCDMVPNHTGIDSLWLREHPDWFMQTPVKPFPAYSFNSENLSDTDDAKTQIEDHYFSHSDAAVVFRHEEKGRTRYIYHGNDGTGLPWNDTAQLNHLIPDVRTALIQTALQLAQKFDFIRFDAAMTLLKEHYRRLWYPAPHAGPVIASRSAFAMDDSEFDGQMPEFWRDLVDTFREKSPGTLLMAEAFWLTENYFIGAIGIHRVYNSAFMHFLCDEKNAEFAAFMENHLKAPKTLNRFVNYLSTPDEKPASELFGNADKYFGAMTLMATLPGLPLLAPGQLEGFTEKYAMDQRLPRLAENKNREFIDRHRREIAPLLAMRTEFADATRLTWLKVEPATAALQVIAFETGVTRKFRILFNNAPSPADFSIAGFQFSLEPYESRVVLDSMAVVSKDSPESGKTAASNHVYPQPGNYYAGVTIPVSALRSHLSCGIGEFSDLKLLVDWCVETSQDFIALLPVSDTGSNPSPYSACSAFALHPVYLRLSEMPGFESVRLEAHEFQNAAQTGKTFRFDDIVQFKFSLLRKIYNTAAEEFFATLPPEFAAQQWLVDYAVYRNIKSRLGEAPAYAWSDYPAKPADIVELFRENTPQTRRLFFKEHIADTGFYVWLQYHAELQLMAAAQYARQHGVFIKGDLPILLERDSVDVWLNPHLFRADLKAGAPPDQYSADGQNWGFPIYDWPAHRRDGYAWWISRIRRAEKFFAAYRIDHVLGFFRIWCLAADDSSGYCGFFLPSSSVSEPELAAILSAEKIRVLSEDSNRERALIRKGDDYFAAWDFDRKLGSAPLSPEEKSALRELISHRQQNDAEIQRSQGSEILSALASASPMLACAEDLGAVPAYVAPTLAALKILSLCVLRWRHRGDTLESPADYPYLSVATPSVHDSGNLREWLLDEGARYFSGNDRIQDVLKTIYDSASALALVPVQDLLALDAALHGPPEKERINVPGTVSDKNWSYRLPVYLEDLLKRTELNREISALCAPRRTRR